MRAIAAFGSDRHHRRKVVAVEQRKDIVRRERAFRFATASSTFVNLLIAPRGLRAPFPIRRDVD